ncbi:MAG: hypothetical protein IH974_08730 [Myxococcales bacterium]|nr:hypothetical protein [Myxococcales bacterium]
MVSDVSISDKLVEELNTAEAKAWDSLGRYKFQMFGYWAAIWVHLNRIGGFKLPNPWSGLVRAGRETGKGPTVEEQGDLVPREDW